MSDPTDVLVVGAGPTGLAAALTAFAHGASVRVVDRRQERFRPSRAMMLHARALECLRPLGVSHDLLDRADTSPEARIHLGSRVVQARLGHVDLPDTAFPHLTLLRQADLEDVLHTALRARGVRVEWGTEFLGLEPERRGDAAVCARLRTGDGRSQQHRARFLAGCDGQSSAVRGLIGGQWRGAPYGIEAVLADVELGGALEPGLLHVAVGRSGLAFLFALGEGATWRMLATRARRPSPGAAFGQLGPPVPPPEVRRLLEEAGLGPAVQEVRWSSCVPLQHRVASRFRLGPLFLAGDAAHAHSPAGGQGMNNGILDAVNLGWKLALAPASDAPSQLLGSYELERRRAAWEVLALTHLVFFGEASAHPAARLARGVLLPLAAPVLPALLGARRPPAAAVRLLAQPFVHYRGSPISVDAAPRAHRWPRPGDRLPDESAVARGRRVRLHELTAAPGLHLLFERDADPAGVAARLPLGAPVHLHRLQDHPGTGVLAVRPDGYVGFRCGQSDAPHLTAWLRSVGALPGRSRQARTQPSSDFP